MDTILQHYMPGGGRSKFRDVVAAIRSAIAQGSLAPGDQLPPVRDLAWKLDMTPGTVARAYAALTDEGITEGQVGRGTFIAPPSTPVQFVPEPWFDAGLAIEAEADDQVSLFATALPDMGQVALIHSAFARLGSRSPRDLLAYPSRSTFEPARRAVLHWLSGAALGPIDHEDLVLSHGGQSGVSLVMQSVLHGRKPVVLLEELTYPGFRRAAQLLRADVVSVPMDAQASSRKRWPSWHKSMTRSFCAPAPKCTTRPVFSHRKNGASRLQRSPHSTGCTFWRMIVTAWAMHGRPATVRFCQSLGGMCHRCQNR